MSSEPRLIGAEELRARLPMAAAVDALDEAFRTLDPEAGPLRTEVETPRGSLLLMPAFGERGVGVKLVTLTPANPGRGLPFIHASYVLFDPETQSPEAILDGTALTALRTAAVSGLATRHLAREDASSVGRLRRRGPGPVAPRGDVHGPPGDPPRRRVPVACRGRGARAGGRRSRPGSPAG